MENQGQNQNSLSLGSAGASYATPCDSDVEPCDMAPTDNMPSTEIHTLASVYRVN